MDDIKCSECNLELSQITTSSILNFVKNLDKNISSQTELNIEYQKNGYESWKNFVRYLENCI